MIAVPDLTRVLCLLGFAAGLYPIEGFSGSTELECLPSTLSWKARRTSKISSDTIIMGATFHLGMFILYIL